MVCIYCHHKTSVVNSRTSVKTLVSWRRRQCTHCQSIVTTYEHIDYASALRVAQSNKPLQPFVRDKLLLSLHSSLQHRKSALNDASELTDTVINQLLTSHNKGIVTTKVITVVVNEVLQRFDVIAFQVYKAKHL